MKSIFLVAVALCCGLVAAVGAFQYLDKAQAASKLEMREVLIASSEININEALTEQNVRRASLPKSVVQHGALTDLDKLENKYARVRLYPGEPILLEKVMGVDDTSGSLKVPLGYRVVSVNVTSESSVSSLIEPGDRVDIIVVLRQTRENPVAIAKTILKAVRVFAVNSEMARTMDADKTLDQARTVSVLLKPEQVETLMMAADLGNIQLALRSPDDSDVDETTGCTIEKIFGNGDVADETFGNGEIRVPGITAAKQTEAEATDPADREYWTMVIASPHGSADFSWSEEGSTPERVEDTPAPVVEEAETDEAPAESAETVE
jgi:pilus assembly protein CpaB